MPKRRCKDKDDDEEKIKKLRQMEAVLDELLKCQCATVEACVNHALDDTRASEISKA